MTGKVTTSKSSIIQSTRININSKYQTVNFQTDRPISECLLNCEIEHIREKILIFLHPTRQKIGHFRHALPSQFLG